MWQCKNSVALILACAMAPLSWSGTAEIFSRAESLVYSENLPIDSWLNDMQGATAEPGNEAITHNQLEIGAAYGGFELSAFYQRDYYFYFTNDTFDLVYRNKNDLPFENREKY